LARSWSACRGDGCDAEEEYRLTAETYNAFYAMNSIMLEPLFTDKSATAMGYNRFPLDLGAGPTSVGYVKQQLRVHSVSDQAVAAVAEASGVSPEQPMPWAVATPTPLAPPAGGAKRTKPGAKAAAKSTRWSAEMLPALSITDVDTKMFDSVQRSVGLTRVLARLYLKDMGIKASKVDSNDRKALRDLVRAYMCREPPAPGMLHGVYRPKGLPFHKGTAKRHKATDVKVVE
jgi:hypothetical protein